MTTLVTGAGMVGSLVAGELLAQGEQRPILYDVAFSMPNLHDRIDVDAVQLVTGDITEVAELLAVIEANGVDQIIHTAGMLSSDVNVRAAAGVRVNVMGTVAVLEAARLCGVRRMVFCSSGSAVLGRRHPKGEPVIENVALACVDDHPPNVYSTAKLASEWLCQNYRDVYGLSTVSIRPIGVFGPWIGAPSGQPARLMRAVVEGGWRDGRVVMTPADIGQSMDFVYAADVARGLVLACKHPSPPSPVYNISMGVTHSVGDAVAILAEVLGREVALEATEQASTAMTYAPGPTFDISLAGREIGYSPAYPMRRAVEDYVAWMEKRAAAR